jgi:hypothetical protein
MKATENEVIARAGFCLSHFPGEAIATQGHREDLKLKKIYSSIGYLTKGYLMFKE